MPIVLLINKVGVVPLPAGVDRTYDGVMDHLKADVDRFTAASEIPVVGCFLRARGNLDQAEEHFRASLDMCPPAIRCKRNAKFLNLERHKRVFST